MRKWGKGYTRLLCTTFASSCEPDLKINTMPTFGKPQIDLQLVSFRIGLRGARFWRQVTFGAGLGGSGKWKRGTSIEVVVGVGGHQQESPGVLKSDNSVTLWFPDDWCSAVQVRKN